jgi:hypothetical protein
MATSKKSAPRRTILKPAKRGSRPPKAYRTAAKKTTAKRVTKK